MRTIDKLLDAEATYFKVRFRMVDLIFAAVMLALGLIFRLALYDIASGDYTLSFADWMRECHEAGGIAYLGIQPGVSDASTFDYNCMFQYIIVLLHYIGGGVKDIYLVKTVSVIFDVVCAVTIGRITFEATSGDVRKSVLAFGCIMFLPTSVLNSGAWAQNDAIFGSFLLLSFLHFMKGNSNRGFIYLAISYSFKQQAIFLAPFVIILWLKDKIKLRYVFWVPVIYVLSTIPAVIAGRDFGELMGIYGSQATMFSRLSMNYPSIYTIITGKLDTDIRKQLIPAGVICTIAIFGALAYVIRNKKFRITKKYMVTLAIFTMLLCCFCLPTMHERYAYVAELLAVVYGLLDHKKVAVCAFLQVIAMITYTRFLFGSTVTVLWPLTVAMLVIILAVGRDLYLQMNIPEEVHE
ncbi:MAG: hypothetical protein E7307_12075 [Butyrivibrio sp.]|nr:hypothetical protein [Butyrivibrio sp.]